MNIFRTVMQLLNATWAVKEPSAERRIGDFVNGTFRGGMLGAVVSGRADVAFCGLWMIQAKQRVVALSAPWQRGCVTFLAPRPGRRRGPWGGVFAPFSRAMWLATAGALAAMALALRAERCLHRRLVLLARRAHAAVAESGSGAEALVLLGALLQTTSAPEARARPTRRCLLAAWAALSLLLVTAYGCRLALYLTLPLAARPLDSVRDLVHAGFSWGSHYELPIRDIFDHENPYEEQFGARFRPESSLAQRLERLRSKRYAIIGVKLGKSFSPEGYPLPEDELWKLRITQKCTEAFYLTLAMPRHSPLKPHVDATVLRLSAGGFIMHWQRRLLISERVFADVSPEEAAKAAGPLILRLYNLRGAFVLFAAGHLLAAVTFVGGHVQQMAAGKIRRWWLTAKACLGRRN